MLCRMARYFGVQCAGCAVEIPLVRYRERSAGDARNEHIFGIPSTVRCPRCGLDLFYGRDDFIHFQSEEELAL